MARRGDGIYRRGRTWWHHLLRSPARFGVTVVLLSLVVSLAAEADDKKDMTYEEYTQAMASSKV
jgi:hypothetical protein